MSAYRAGEFEHVCGDLRNRVLIDVTNPIRFTDTGMELEFGFDTSAGEKVASLASGPLL